jgi:multidrug resistance efflux pump
MRDIARAVVGQPFDDGREAIDRSEAGFDGDRHQVTNILALDALGRGDEAGVIFRIDPARYSLALKTAKAKAGSSKAALDMANRDLVRYLQLVDATVTRQKLEQMETNARRAEASYRQTQLDQHLATLNLERSSVKAPVSGIVTNLGIHPGDFLAAWAQAVALIYTGSLRIEGYFEETKLRQVAIGDRARVRLMGDDAEITGRVESIGCRHCQRSAERHEQSSAEGGAYFS